jgi:energy-coupling factor transport system ATP-binding protein
MLTEIGLDIPQITRLVLALRARGVDIDTDIYTVEQAKAATEQIIKNKRSGSKC